MSLMFVKDSVDSLRYNSLNELIEKSPEVQGFRAAFEPDSDSDEDISINPDYNSLALYA
jgi:hypothetical protein